MSSPETHHGPRSADFVDQHYEAGRNQVAGMASCSLNTSGISFIESLQALRLI